MEGKAAKYPWIVAIGSALLILSITVVPVFWFDLLTVEAGDSGTKVVAAVLALVGGSIAAAVTLVGTVLKFSIDERNLTLARETEQRNKIEAAIRAISLLGENKADSAPSQLSGALLALVSLNELELALSILEDLWHDDKVSSGTAEVILKRVLDRGADDEPLSDSIVITASTLVLQNVTRLEKGSAYYWPIMDAGWRSDLPIMARLHLAMAAALWYKAARTSAGSYKDAPLHILAKALEDEDDNVKEFAALKLLEVVGEDTELKANIGYGEVDVEDRLAPFRERLKAASMKRATEIFEEFAKRNPAHSGQRPLMKSLATEQLLKQKTTKPDKE
jgi:hypothetical protein